MTNLFEMDFLTFFIILNLFNVMIQTVKSLFTIKGDKWSASIMNAVTYFVYTYVIVFTATEGLSVFHKACVVAGCNLVGVFIVKFIEEKIQKDKLWIYQATCKEDTATVKNIHNLLKEMGIACLYSEVIPNELYSMQIFSHTPKESTMIKSILENYDVKYCATETKDSSPKPKEKKVEASSF